MPPAKKPVAPEEKRCVGRACGLKFQDPGMKYARYQESRCINECADPDSKLCGTCIKREKLYESGANIKTTWHGRMGGPIPAKSHIVGSEWALAQNIANAGGPAPARRTTAKKAASPPKNSAAKAASPKNTSRKTSPARSPPRNTTAKAPKTNALAAARAARAARAALNVGSKTELKEIGSAVASMAALANAVKEEVQVAAAAANTAKASAKDAVEAYNTAKGASNRVKELLAEARKGAVVASKYIVTAGTTKKNSPNLFSFSNMGATAPAPLPPISASAAYNPFNSSPKAASPYAVSSPRSAAASPPKVASPYAVSPPRAAAASPPKPASPYVNPAKNTAAPNFNLEAELLASMDQEPAGGGVV